MRLEGWNTMPDGYGSRFEINRAPLWLRLWFRTPVLDKFAYPVAVRRGFGYLTAQPEWPAEMLGQVGPGWRMNLDRGGPPEVALQASPIARPGALRRRRRRYARSAWQQRYGRWVTLPTVVQLPRGRLLERRSCWYWRIRFPLCAVLGIVGAVIAGWPGVVLGPATAVLAELLASYHLPNDPAGTGTPA
jgi:hypothetical protein